MSAAPPQSAIAVPDRSTSDRERASVRAAFWAAAAMPVAAVALSAGSGIKMRAPDSTGSQDGELSRS